MAKSSIIKETKTVAEILTVIQGLTGRVLYIFDFDNVLGWLGPEVTIGTDPWFAKHLQTGHEELGDLTAAELATLKIFTEVHNNTPILPVEAETINLIQELHRDGKCVVTLTSRSGKYLNKLTREQANALGVCFSNSSRFKSRTVDLTHLGPHCHVEDGYFYTGGKNKGVVLKHGLEALGIAITDYDTVVFVDDDLNKIKQVQEMLVGVTNFVGFRYGFLDKHLEKLTETMNLIFRLRAKM